MKKILFSCYGLGVGGIERCLVNLLNALDDNKYEIDVLLMNPEYELQNQITEKVTYINGEDFVYNSEDSWNIRSNNKKRIPFYYVFRILNKLQFKPWLMFKSIRKEYDIAIAYSQNDFSPYYVIDKVSAKKKFLWYHNGSYIKNSKQYKIDKKYYSKFDNIITVSHDAKKMLGEKFPELTSKILILHNIMQKDEITEKAKEPMDIIFSEDYFNIVTVGRMTKEKGAELALEVCDRIVKADYPIHWYWIGDGNQFQYIKGLISEKGLEEIFLLLGNKENPYKYMKNCDLYVQPSFYEAYCTTTNEARVLGKVIVATDVGGMREQIIDGKTGYIVETNVEAIYKKIEETLNNRDVKEKIEDELAKTNYLFDKYIDEYEVLFN